MTSWPSAGEKDQELSRRPEHHTAQLAAIVFNVNTSARRRGRRFRDLAGDQHAPELVLERLASGHC